MLNLAVLLEDSAREYPDRIAVVDATRRLTYRELDDQATRVAQLLVQRGVGPGDKVALACPNVAEFPVCYFGILKAGGVVVPLNILLTAPEIAYHLADSEARAFLCHEGLDDLPLGERGRSAYEQTPSCETLLPIDADFGSRGEALSGDLDTARTRETDTAVVLYTSGTTGRAKGAELSHSNLVHNALMSNRMFRSHGHDVHLVALPLFHTFGQSVQMNAGLAAGATLVLMARFDAADALDLMDREEVTFFAGVPTMYWGLLHAPSAVSADLAAIAARLRIALSGGASLPVELQRDFETRFDIPILEGYGLSETSPLATFHRPGGVRKLGSIGVPVWGVEVRVAGRRGEEVAPGDPGEIWIRGHNVMKGYLGRPDATAEAIDPDGWFHTGDVGVRDEDGYLYVVDRQKDLIIRGGYNVYPRELEEVLHTHPEVSLAAVVGVPHPSHGEEVKAYVVRTPGATATEEALLAWCRERMAAYKRPRLMEFREELPMTATGKILKRALAR